jgi:hypothetical protein
LNISLNNNRLEVERRISMAYQGYKKNSSMALKQFISEFGGTFSKHMKEKLLELESRSFLTRKEINNRFDLKHVEHIEYECTRNAENVLGALKKEYSYGQFEVIEGVLYFSEVCLENDQVMQSPMVDKIYHSLNSEDTIFNNGRNLKKVDDKNIGYVVDSILSECPNVSQAYLDIVKGMVSRSNNKKPSGSNKTYIWGNKSFV